MATKTVYIPDDLFKQVEKHKDRINLSAIFQEALKRNLEKVSISSTEQFPREELESAIERLRREKDELKQQDYEEGVKEGREWALQRATYEELSTYEENDSLPEHIETWLNERRHDGEVIDYDAFYEGWFKAVEEIWEAIKDKI